MTILEILQTKLPSYSWEQTAESWWVGQTASVSICVWESADGWNLNRNHIRLDRSFAPADWIVTGRASVESLITEIQYSKKSLVANN